MRDLAVVPHVGAVGHQQIVGTLNSPVLEFDLAADVDGLNRDESWFHPAGRSSRTLVKYPDLRVVLITMRANTQIHEHTATGRLSVQVLRGHIRLHLPERIVDVPAGRLVALDRCVPHDVQACEDSAFLLTLSWPKAAGAQ